MGNNLQQFSFGVQGSFRITQDQIDLFRWKVPSFAFDPCGGDQNSPKAEWCFWNLSAFSARYPIYSISWIPMLNPTIQWCGEGTEKQTLYNFNRYKFNKYSYSDIWLLCLILSYISQQRSHALCDLIKTRARLTVKLGSYMIFIEVETWVRQIYIPAFPAFPFWFLPNFSTAQSQLSVHFFNVLQHLLINSCHFLLETSFLGQQVAQVSGMSSQGKFHHPCLLTSELY